MTTMLAARGHAGDSTVRLEQIDVPEPGPDDVIVKVASAGLAPGMMLLLARGAFRHLPTTLGHEAAGTIEAVGSDVDAALVGRRVRVHPVLACRCCVYCQTDREQMCTESAMIGHAAFGTGPLALYARYHDGGFAEYIRVPHWLVDTLPDNVSFDVGAKVHDLANAVRALKCTSLPLGGTLLVTAATGTMGTATIKLAPFFGAARVILVGRSAERLEALRALAGPLAVDTVALEDLDPDWAQSQGLTRRIRALAPAGVDAVTDYFPEGPGSTQALASLATGGTLVHMGANTTPFLLPAIAIMVNLWRIVGTRACTRTDAADVLRLLGSGALQVDELITHEYPLAEIDAALTSVQERREPMWMGVVHP
ncbi:MAG: alcohol dehydrogenase catalytic domain-containing protein [Actinomycetota bacterium]|nr:alcohol dehydrogenase catalytic domain-containing protein [Actinomycetota bacterium]